MIQDIIDERHRPHGELVTATLVPLYAGPTAEQWTEPSRQCSIADAVAWATDNPFKVQLVLEDAS